MSFSQMRPRTPQLVELHVFYVPEEVWNFQLNTVPVALSSKFISAGFIRVSPHITLRVLREKLGEYLGEAAVADKFKFLKCIGKKLAVIRQYPKKTAITLGRLLTFFLNMLEHKLLSEHIYFPKYKSTAGQGHGNLIELHLHDQIFVECFFLPPGVLFHNSSNVKAKQETELELKSFAPPYALYPELYLLPGVEYFEDVYPLSSSTQQRHHYNAKANRFGHGSRLPCLTQQKPEKGKQFLESIQSSSRLEYQEGQGPVEWGEKEPVPIFHTKHEQDHNNRIQEKQIQFREKDQNGPLFTASNSNPADWESGKSDMVLQTSQQSHLRQDPKEHPTPKQSGKAKGATLTLHVNSSDEQGQNNQTAKNHIKYQSELMNMENNDHQKDTKLRRGRTEDAGILKIMEDQTTEYVYKNQSLQQYRTSKCIADPGEKLDNQADENKQNHPICPKEYISPPSPPFLSLSVNPAQVPSIQAAKNKMLEQLQEMKKDRRHMEKTREELIKKVKGLLEQNKLRRYHVREEWKKKYFETKKATVSLEEALSKLRQDVELYHQKLLLQLEARDSRKRPNNMTNSKNYHIIQITTVQHELDQLRRKLDDTKMKLVIEIKMRKQAASDLRALRAELTQKKIHAALILQSRESGI